MCVCTYGYNFKDPGILKGKNSLLGVLQGFQAWDEEIKGAFCLFFGRGELPIFHAKLPSVMTE